MPTKKYSDEDKVRALAMLAANGNNLKATALQLGIPRTTLIDWSHGRKIQPAVIVEAEQQKKSLAEMFDEVATKALGSAVDRLDAEAKTMPIKELIDISKKAVETSRLLKGEPTQIQEQGSTSDYAKKLEALRAVRAEREQKRLAKVS